MQYFTNSNNKTYNTCFASCCILSYMLVFSFTLALKCGISSCRICSKYSKDPSLIRDGFELRLNLGQVSEPERVSNSNLFRRWSTYKRRNYDHVLCVNVCNMYCLFHQW